MGVGRGANKAVCICVCVCVYIYTTNRKYPTCYEMLHFTDSAAQEKR